MREQLAHLPNDKPFLMLNALWYKPDGGRAMYTQYLKAAQLFVEQTGAKAVNIAVPGVALIGEFDADLVFFVEYPNKQAFLDLINNPDYQAVAHLREEAIIKSLLVPCFPIGGKS